MSVAAYNRVIKADFEPGETLRVWAFFDGQTVTKLRNVYLTGYDVKP